MEFIIGNKVKTSWAEITVADFFLLDEIEKDSNLSLTEKYIKILSILSDSTEEEIRKLKNDTIKDYFENELSFLKTEVQAELKDYYHVNGRKYRLIRQIDDLTAGQFIDLMTYTKDRANVLDSLHLILTVFLIPVRDLTTKQIVSNLIFKILPKKISKFLNWKYQEGTTENYLETPVNITSEEFYQHMKITDAMSITVFFCILNRLFSIVTVLYLEEMKNRKLNSVLKTLEMEIQTPEIQNLKQELTNIIQNGHG